MQPPEPAIPLPGPPAAESAADQAHALAPSFKALADENRLTLILLLARRPYTVRELTDATGMSQTLVSHHLAPLRQHGLVAVTPRGRSNIYVLCRDALAAPLRLLATLAAGGTPTAPTPATPSRSRPADTAHRRPATPVPGPWPPSGDNVADGTRDRTNGARRATDA